VKGRAIIKIVIKFLNLFNKKDKSKNKRDLFFEFIRNKSFKFSLYCYNFFNKNKSNNIIIRPFRLIR